MKTMILIPLVKTMIMMYYWSVKWPQFCLKIGDEITFTICDPYGDGICCVNGSGSYIGYLDGEKNLRAVHLNMHSVKRL